VFELSASCLLGRSSTTCAMPSTLSALVNFEIVSHIFLTRAGLDGLFLNRRILST
jgi:hypothetical protein